MIKSNVILLLRTFTSDELKQFEEFLDSPFHNKNNKAIQFFNVLKNYHPEYDDPVLTKENLFKQLFQEVKYKESYIRNLFSDLNILAESFLQNIHLSKNYSYDKFLIEELNERNVPELMEKKIRMFEKKIESDIAKDQDYYLNRIFIYDMKGFLTTDKTLVVNYRPDEILNKISLFLLTIMESYFQLIIEEQRVNINHNYSFLKHILSYLKVHIDEFNQSPLLMIYYNLWQCFFGKNDEEHYLNGKALLKEHFDSLANIDKKNIYAIMQTYCINKIDNGDKFYSRELLNILLEMLENNVVSHNKDRIHLNLYRNILMLCNGLKEVGILEKFIPEYINYVSPESRESMSAYSYAHLNFLQGHFEKALELCNEIDFNDLLITANENLYFKNDVKKLTLMCLYELNSFESAISLIDAHKHFLRNARLIKEFMKKKNMNFLNLVTDLIKLKLNFDEFNLLKFKSKISSTEKLANREWLIEKAAAMEIKI